MLHARLTFLGALSATIAVAGCAGPGWFAHGEYGRSRQPRTPDEREVATSTSAAETTRPDSSEPSLAQVLDAIERINTQNPPQMERSQNSVEEMANAFPPEYRQLATDQLAGVAALNQQGPPPQVAPTVVPATQPAQVLPAPHQPYVQTLPPPALASLISQQTSTPAIVAPASYSTSVAPSVSEYVPQIAAVTAQVSDVPAQHSVQEPASPIQPVAPATVLSTSALPEKLVKKEETLEPGQWSREIEQALTSLIADLARPNLDREERARLEIMRRLLYVATNQRDEAVSPIEQLDEDEREYWKHQMHGLLVSMDAEGKHPTTRRAALALRDLRTATDHLANVSTLDVRNLTFCQEVLSYGEYRVFDSYTFRAKDEVVMYVEIDNFAAHPRGDSFETELHSSYEITDDAGRRVANVVLPVDKQVSNNRRRDYFIAYLITMPTQIASGSYRLQLTVEDVIGKKSNHSALDFRIQ